MSINYEKLAVAGLEILSTPKDTRSLVYNGASNVEDGQIVVMPSHGVCSDLSGAMGERVGVVQHHHVGKSGRSGNGSNAYDVYIEGDCLPVTVQGRIWVKPIGNVPSAGKSTNVYVYVSAENLGKLTASDQGANSVLLDGAWWDTVTTPDGFAILQLENPVTANASGE